MRLFLINTRGLDSTQRTDWVLASAAGGLTDTEVAEDAAVSANPDPLPVLVEQSMAASGEIDVDARGAGSGPAKVFYSTGTDWAGRATHHFIVAKDTGALIIFPWNIATTYFLTFANQVSYAGLNYLSLQTSNLGNQPDISPTWWAVDPDAEARRTAELAVTDIDATYPSWEIGTLYRSGAPASTPASGFNWFALSENIGHEPPGNIWETAFIFAAPDWDAITSYIPGDQVMTHGPPQFWQAVVANLNVDPRTNSTPYWSVDTVIVQESLVRIGGDVTIEV